MDLPLGKSRFLDEIQIFFLKLPIESVCRKMFPETLFRPPKKPGTKKLHKKDEVRVRVKTKIVSQGVIYT